MLGSASRFLPGPGSIEACSVSVPLSMDARAAVAAAGGLVGAGVRSFELWWDGDERRLELVLAAGAGDIAAYRRAFANMYPNAAFAAMDSAVPGWFAGGAGQVFDVGTYHGHYASVLDSAGAHQVVTQIANTVQLARHAWIQFVFCGYNFGAFLRRHVTRLDEKAAEVARGGYLSVPEVLLHPDRRPHAHPEAGYDFENNYRGLQRHATLKMQSAHLLMSVRGVLRGGSPVHLNFDEIGALPVENIHSGHEHLTKFRYPAREFWPPSSATRISVGRRPAERIEMFGRRLLPDPAPLLDAALGRYFGRGLFGYRERRPLPFLLLNLSEVPLFVHLPSPATPNMATTRGVVMPAMPSGKEGSPLGYAAAGGGGRPAWGGIAGTREGAAVIAPEDLANHVYCVGASGSGKTSLVRILAKHLEAWNEDGTLQSAFIYLDPKGDDSARFIRQCGRGALEGGRVRYLDPQETRFSINPLELPPHEPGAREETVSRYVGYFMKTIEEWYRQSASYVQMERIFRALLFYMYMRNDAPTFLDMHDVVLRLQAGGEKALAGIAEAFGEPEPGMRRALAGIASLRGEAFVPLLNRIEQFATDPVLRRIFSVRHGTVDFGELVRPGMQTIVRMSPLNMPQHVQPLAMQAFILKLWFTIQERANADGGRGRTQVVLALDEFQVVKDLQVLQLMLEQARSLGLGLVLSHQTTEQISDRQLGIITGNSGTQLVGRVNGRDAARMAQIWDPQFQQELRRQFASQEYFRWTVREKAPPGREQPPPAQFWLCRPPGPELGPEGYRLFVAGQLARYGRGEPAPPLTDAAGPAAGRWAECLPAPLPGRTEWAILLMLRGSAMRQVEIVRRLGAPNRSAVAPVLAGMVSAGSVGRASGMRNAPYMLTGAGRRTYFGHRFGLIGTAADVVPLARRVAGFYEEKGMFVAVASQGPGPGDRTDMAAFDYGRGVPISVEIESASEAGSHPEHVRYNMTKWRDMGFSECHVWSHSRRVRRIYEEDLDEGGRKGVHVFVI